MLLMLMQVTDPHSTQPRGISVWVDDSDVERAKQRAIAALADAGWQHLNTHAISETDADDYFRVCPSQQAFMRAQEEGIAWRFDDEADVCKVN